MSDSRDIARHEPPPAAPSESSKTLAMILEAARDPAIDAAKTEQMVNLALKLQDREREEQFNRSKNAALSQMPVITRSGLIVINDKHGNFVRNQGRFARWEDIDRIVRPILDEHSLALSFDVGERETGGVLVTPILTHRNGYTERGHAMPVPADLSGAKNAAQAIGSAISYGKRYTACAMLNIVTEGIDDDGNMGASTMVSLPYERQAVVEKDARAAHAAGNYQEWFDTQPPRDRAWLVENGLHEEFGGKALPAPTSAEIVVDQAEAQRRSPPSQLGNGQIDQSPKTDQPRQKKSPRQWVDEFKAAVEAYRNLDALDQFWDEQRDNLDRLRQTNQTLWNEADQAIRDRRTAIEDGRLM